MLHAQMGKSFEDLRGVGIQVTKLEKDAGSNSGDGAGRTKSMLNFVQKLDKAPPPPSEIKKSPLPPQQRQESLSISFSQVDPEVLAELPEDIRKEIQQSCRLKAGPSTSSSSGRAKNDKADKVDIDRNDKIDNCDKSDNIGKVDKTERTDNLEVTFSQLDPDVLAALPEELRTEVEREYSRPRPKRVSTSTTTTAFDRGTI